MILCPLSSISLFYLPPPLPSFSSLTAEPTVSIDSNSMVLNQGTTLTISPRVNLGNPAAVITWQRDSTVLDPTTDSRISIDTQTGILSVTDLKGSDRGLYIIKLTNAFSMVDASVMVTVNCECFIKRLLILSLCARDWGELCSRLKL